MQKKQGGKKRGEIGRERGNACKRSQKVDRSGIWIQVYPLIGNLVHRAPWRRGCLIGRYEQGFC